MKDVIQAKKVAYNKWIEDKADSCLHSRYAEARKPATLAEEKYKLDSSYWQASKVFWQIVQRVPGKRSRSDRPNKDQNGDLPSSEEDVLGKQREHFKNRLNLVTITP